MNPKVLGDSRLFEKIEIQWFTISQIRSQIKKFRRFYQDILQQYVLSDLHNIQHFIDNKHHR